MHVTEYFHREAAKAIPANLRSEVNSVLKEIRFQARTRKKEFRFGILKQLKILGWSDAVRIHEFSKISVTSMKGDTALCFQTGNMGRFYADLLKLETLFRKDRIKAAIYLIPHKSLAKYLGSNIANFERFTEELKIFSVTLTIPMLVLGIASED